MADLRLHGYPVSNYFNAARAAMMESGVPFEMVIARASQDAEFLSRSAMGKIPYLETPHGCIAETIAMLEYLEDASAGHSLYPADIYARAQTRQVINIIQLYIDTPLRTLYPGVFMGGVNTEAAVQSARIVLERAMGALRQLVRPFPFFMGAHLSHADLMAFYTFDLGERVFAHVYGDSLLSLVPGLPAWFAMMGQRPVTKTILSDFETAFAAYLRDRNAAWREPELALS